MYLINSKRNQRKSNWGNCILSYLLYLHIKLPRYKYLMIHNIIIHLILLYARYSNDIQIYTCIYMYRYLSISKKSTINDFSNKSFKVRERIDIFPDSLSTIQLRWKKTRRNRPGKRHKFHQAYPLAYDITKSPSNSEADRIENW